jgi:hypothetical protein
MEELVVLLMLTVFEQAQMFTLDWSSMTLYLPAWLLQMQTVVQMSRSLAAAGLRVSDMVAHCGFIWSFMFEVLAPHNHPAGRLIMITDMSGIKLGQAVGEGQVRLQMVASVDVTQPVAHPVAGCKRMLTAPTSEARWAVILIWSFMFEVLAPHNHPAGRLIMITNMSGIKLGQAVGEGQVWLCMLCRVLCL